MAARFVLLISQDRLSVYQARGGIPEHMGDFAAEAEEIAEFSAFVAQEKNALFHLVLDLAEESFSHETVPKLSLADRQRYAARKLSQNFMRSPYRTASWLNHKKQSVLLMAGLTDSTTLEMWLTPLLEAEAQVVAIQSVPLLSSRLLKRLEGVGERFALVHGTAGSNVRFTYFRDGKPILSRVALIPPQLDLAQALQAEGARLFDYLASVRELGFNDRLPMVMIHDGLIDVDVDAPPRIHERVDVEVVDVESLMDKWVAHDAAELFAGLAVTRGIGTMNHYALPVTRRFYLLSRVRRALWGTVAAAVCMSVGLFAWTKWQDQVVAQSYAQMLSQAASIEAQAVAMKPALKAGDPIPADEKAMVENLNVIRRHWPSPTLGVRVVESMLANHPMLSLQHAEWRLADPKPASPDAPPTPANQPRPLNEPLPSELILKLAVKTPDLPYRTVLDSVDKLRLYLARFKIESAIEAYPMDILPSGSLNVQDAQMPKEGFFELRLTLPLPKAGQ